MSKYLVEKEALDKVFEYLIKKPFVEVHEIVAPLRAGTQLLTPPTEATKEAPPSDEQAQS